MNYVYICIVMDRSRFNQKDKYIPDFFSYELNFYFTLYTIQYTLSNIHV